MPVHCSPVVATVSSEIVSVEVLLLLEPLLMVQRVLAVEAHVNILEVIRIGILLDAELLKI